MSTWKKLAVALFPEHCRGLDAFQKPHMNIYQVFFQLRRDFENRTDFNEQDLLRRILILVNWCIGQQERAPDISNAAATAFLEHMADDDKSADLIPYWVRPEIFIFMRDEFERRRERDGQGKFKTLLEKYNLVNNTNME